MQAGRRRQDGERLVVAQLVQQAAQPAVRLYLVDAQAAEPSEPERERGRLADGEFPCLRGAKRAQGLAQHVAVYLDPPIAEEDERRALVQQELDLLLGDDLAIHADRQLRRDAASCRGSAFRRGGLRLQLGGGGHVFARDAIW